MELAASINLKLSDVPAQAPEVIGRFVDGEAVLVHPRQGKVRVLNAVGARLWELTDGQRSVEDLAQALTVEYEVDLARARADVLAFCQDLLGRGLLTIAS